MGKRRRDPGREQYWRGVVSAWQASGLSVREFSRRRQVSEASLYGWRRELLRRDEQSGVSSSPAFIPLTVVPSAMVEVHCPSGHVVTVSHTDGDTLRQLFAALVPEASC